MISAVVFRPILAMLVLAAILLAGVLLYAGHAGGVGGAVTVSVAAELQSTGTVKEP